MKLEEIKKGLKHTAKLTAKDEGYYELMCNSIDVYLRDVERELKAAYLDGQAAGIDKCCKVIKEVQPDQQEDWTLPF